jgi:alcohol dehydrogenase class IV
MTYQPESVWEFSIADNVTFGVGAVDEVSDVVAERDASSVLVVTDRGVADAGILDTVTAALGDVECAVFDGVEPDPSLSVFEDAVEVAGEADPDAVVGVGGGSSMDVAKTVGVVHEHGGSVLDYVAPPTGGGEPVPGPGVPTVCLPTTAGTGSEVSPVSVISLPEEDLKVGISSPHQRPDVALVDPGLTVTLPPGPTASSGMDALSHAIEAYTTRRYDAKPAPDSRAERPDYNGRSPLTDALARRAIELVGNNLRDAVDNGEDLEARRAMSLGSLLAGAAFTNAGVGATHAIAMAAGAIHHTPHGVTIALAMPSVMRFNATSAPDRYAEIAELLGEDLTATGRHEAAAAAARGVERLAADVGIDGGLSSLGLDPGDVDHVAERASKLERLTVGNPRRIDRDDLETIIRDAL